MLASFWRVRTHFRSRKLGLRSEESGLSPREFYGVPASSCSLPRNAAWLWLGAPGGQRRPRCSNEQVSSYSGDISRPCSVTTTTAAHAQPSASNETPDPAARRKVIRYKSESSMQPAGGPRGRALRVALSALACARLTSTGVLGQTRDPHHSSARSRSPRRCLRREPVLRLIGSVPRPSGSRRGSQSRSWHRRVRTRRPARRGTRVDRRPTTRPRRPSSCPSVPSRTLSR